MPDRPVRTCLGCGKPTRDTRCRRCERINRLKYGRHHQRTRAEWAPIVATGTVECARSEFEQCRYSDPVIQRGEPWDCDHLPDGTDRPSHALCNRASGGRG